MQDQVLFTQLPGKQGDIGVITLNRPEALNALTKNMCILIYNKLAEWEKSTAIKAVVIQGAGDKAFCAGGDVRDLYNTRNKPDQNAREFFWYEYRLIHRIFHFSKPYIALLTGITMGGGVGLSINGSFRVATDTFKFAMPETSIGLFPDVGGSYFLSRFPSKTGLFLALTSSAINVADAYYLGAIHHQIKSADIQLLLNILADTVFNKDAHSTVANILEKLAVPTATSTLAHYKTAIDTCFSEDSVENIINALQNYPDPWCQQIAKLILANSPTSLKVVLEQLKRGAILSFDDCIRMEYNMIALFMRNHDFYEGVRAALIDKDKKPQWQPSDLAQVTDAMVKNYFRNEGGELNFVPNAKMPAVNLSSN